MLGEMKLVLKSNFESLPSTEPSFSQFTQYEQEDLALLVHHTVNPLYLAFPYI